MYFATDKVANNMYENKGIMRYVKIKSMCITTFVRKNNLPVPPKQDRIILVMKNKTSTDVGYRIL